MNPRIQGVLDWFSEKFFNKYEQYSAKGLQILWLLQADSWALGAQKVKNGKVLYSVIVKSAVDGLLQGHLLEYFLEYSTHNYVLSSMQLS